MRCDIEFIFGASAIATIVSMGIAGIYALLLVRGWNTFNGDQRKARNYKLHWF
jgi:hypothetical protein